MFYYNSQTDMLYTEDYAMEGKFIETAKVISRAIVASLQNLIDMGITAITKIVSFAIPNDRIIYGSNEFYSITVGRSGTAIGKALERYVAILKGARFESNMATLGKDIEDISKSPREKLADIIPITETLISEGSNYKVSSVKSDGVDNIIRAGDLKKRVFKIGTLFNTLKGMLRVFGSKEVVKLGGTEEAFKATIKICTVINNTLLKAVLVALVKGKKEASE